MEERELIPYEAADLRGERLLILAPHPDDEVIGCGGLLRLHALEQRNVRVIVATDGAAADPDASSTDYLARREAESIQALEQLGVSSPPRFLRHPDRKLAEARSLEDELAAELEAFGPDLILLPNLLELHPDHVALANALLSVLEQRPLLLASLPATRLAFYEVSQPIRPNTLVDITSVSEAKFDAIDAHVSQTSLRSYRAFAEGLGRYRGMTLPQTVLYAEGYFVLPASAAAAQSRAELARKMSALPAVSVTAETLPITVLVRTRDRLGWLKDALSSIINNDYPSHVVVVNDGGPSPSTLLSSIDGRDRITLVEHTTSLGRSEALNAGVRAATTPWIAFLDDDDLYYSDHLSTVAAAAASSPAAAVYSDAVTVRWEIGNDGVWSPVDRLRIYGEDFDRDLLQLDNYIPLPTLLVRRDLVLEAGGFDPALDLFEDWDFLLRLAGRGDLRHVPRITCEIRHFPSSGSAVQEAPSGSERFSIAKQQVWARNGIPESPAWLVVAIEKQKQRIRHSSGVAMEASGRAARLDLEVSRLLREERYLTIAREQAAASEAHRQELEEMFHKAATEARTEAGRAAWMEAELQRAHARIGELDSLLRIAQEQLDRTSEELRGSYAHGEALLKQNAALETAHEERGRALEQNAAETAAAIAEIARLQDLIRQMESTKAWKTHRLMERMRGAR